MANTVETIPGNARGCASQYETVAASQTTQMLGTVGAAGDYLSHLIVTANASGATAVVAIKDGSLTAYPIGPAYPAIGSYYIPVGAVSVSGGWQVTTLAGATVLAVGNFT